MKIYIKSNSSAMYVVLLILVLQGHVAFSYDYYDMGLPWGFPAAKKENKEPSFLQKIMEKYTDKLQEYGIGLAKYVGEGAYGRVPSMSDTYGYAKTLKLGWDKHGGNIMAPMKNAANSIYSRIFPSYGKLFNTMLKEEEEKQEEEEEAQTNEQAEEEELEKEQEKKLSRRFNLAKFMHGNTVMAPMTNAADSIISSLFPSYGKLFNTLLKEQEEEEKEEQEIEQAQEIELTKENFEKKLQREQEIKLSRRFNLSKFMPHTNTLMAPIKNAAHSIYSRLFPSYGKIVSMILKEQNQEKQEIQAQERKQAEKEFKKKQEIKLLRRNNLNNVVRFNKMAPPKVNEDQISNLEDDGNNDKELSPEVDDNEVSSPENAEELEKELSRAETKKLFKRWMKMYIFRYLNLAR